MYLYSPPFSIVKEKDFYRILDQLGGKYSLDTRTLIATLYVLGKEFSPSLLKDLETKCGINDAKEKLDSLIDNGVITPTKYKRKDSFNYRKVLERIINDNSKEKDLLNIGSVTLANIKHCPYSCEGCYAPHMTAEKNIGSEVKLNKIKQVIEDIVILGANHLTLGGGEVTASEKDAKKTSEISKFARSNGIDSITIVTTGYQLEKFIDLFVNAGVTDFQISLDGLKEYNDTYKKFKGAYERSSKAIEICQKRKVQYTLNAVVSKQNVNAVPEFVGSLVDMGVPSIRLSKIITKSPELEVDVDKGKTLMNIIEELRNKYKLITINGPFDNPYITEGYINCVAGKLYAHIDCFGSVLPCAFMGDRVIGNINQQRFIDLWNLNNPILKSLSEGLRVDNKCNKGKERYACFGNCIADYELKREKCKNEQTFREYYKN